MVKRERRGDGEEGKERWGGGGDLQTEKSRRRQ